MAGNLNNYNISDMSGKRKTLSTQPMIFYFKTDIHIVYCIVVFVIFLCYGDKYTKTTSPVIVLSCTYSKSQQSSPNLLVRASTSA